MGQTLHGMHALIGGASRGIGRATASALAARGATVTGMARNADSLAAAIAELDRSDGQAHDFLAADFDHPEPLRERLAEQLGGKTVQILVNNTGGPPDGPAHSASLEAFRIAFNRHLVCNQVLLQQVLPGMREDGYGRIVNIISTSVKQPIPNLGVSNTIRGAVASWAKTLATELAPDGITVNNVLPGFTTTDRLDEIIERAAERSGKTPDEAADALRASVPAGRFADPGELAQAVAFLASPAAGYINGINLPVDGGRTGCL